MSKPSETSMDRAQEIVRARGGVCLVPIKGRFGISSHEKTFCDCEVEEMIAAALDENEEAVKLYWLQAYRQALAEYKKEETE